MDLFHPGAPEILLGLLSATALVLLLIYLPRGEGTFHIRAQDVVYAVFVFLAPVVVFGVVSMVLSADARSELNRFAMVGMGLVYIPAVVAAYRILRSKSPEPKPSLGLQRTNPLLCVGGSLLVAATFWYPIILLGTAWQEFLLWYGVKPKVQESIRAFQGEGDQALKIASMVAACTLIPFAEEFIFRGIVQPVLRRWAGAAGAVALSTLVFAAIHMEPQVIPMIIPVGLVLAVLYERTRSLYYPIAFHAFFNASMLLTLLWTEQI